MSIKEAIEIGRIERPRVIRQRLSETDTPDPMLVGYSRKTLRDSKVLQGIEELSGIIRETNPDVKIIERVHPNGSVSVDINWNRRPAEGANYRPESYFYNSISVSASPFIDQIDISSKEVTEYIHSSEWNSYPNPTGKGPTKVECALADAYRSPLEIIGPPIRI